MANEWRIARVGDLAHSVSETHRLGKERLIFLNTSDILLGKILHHRYSETRDWPGQAKKSIQKDDILFSEIRPANGRFAYVDIEADDYVVSTKLMVIRARKDQVLPKFLYHFLTSKKITGWLQHLADSRSGTFPQITFDQVAELEMPLPPPSHQAKIASFLDEIDGKIQRNTRMGETLQAIARAIFRSWFVDFDPVHAKAEGHDPGLTKPVADLFPDCFEDSELGEIPKGWRVTPIGDLAEVVGGSTPSTKEPAFWETGINHWATPKDLSALRTPVLLTTERKITDAGLYQISSGLLPAGTVLLSSRAPIGYRAVTEIPVAINQGFIAMRPQQDVSNLFVLLWTEWAHDEILSRANGSTFLEISKAHFRPIPVINPGPAVFHAFDSIVRPLYLRLVANERQSCALTELREGLISKLISGEVRVPGTVAGFEEGNLQP